jgi:hypothetical protein
MVKDLALRWRLVHMDAIEGHGDVGQLEDDYRQRQEQLEEPHEDGPRLGILQGDVTTDEVSPEDWASEFDGIRSELDFRRAMALQTADADLAYRRGTETWSQRALRALSLLRASLRSFRALRPLR